MLLPTKYHFPSIYGLGHLRNLSRRKMRDPNRAAGRELDKF